MNHKWNQYYVFSYHCMVAIFILIIINLALILVLIKVVSRRFIVLLSEWLRNSLKIFSISIYINTVKFAIETKDFLVFNVLIMALLAFFGSLSHRSIALITLVTFRDLCQVFPTGFTIIFLYFFIYFNITDLTNW